MKGHIFEWRHINLNINYTHKSQNAIWSFQSGAGVFGQEYQPKANAKELHSDCKQKHAVSIVWHAGMFSIRTPTDYRCVFLSNLGDNLNGEEYVYK